MELENDAPAILIVCGIHGDEPQSAFVGQCIAELLQTRVGSMMDEHLIVVPCLNPDGLLAFEAGSSRQGEGLQQVLARTGLFEPATVTPVPGWNEVVVIARRLSGIQP